MASTVDKVVEQIQDHLCAETAQDLDALLAGMTEDCFNLVVPDPTPLYRGPAEVARRYQALWAALPDLEVKLRRVITVGEDIAVTEHRLSGTHGGSLFGIPPTGLPVAVDTAVVWELRSGRIRGETVYFDLATILRQIGYLELPGVASGS
jgi:steroid delta-isomerase-like uncharacterized protein